MEREFHIGVMLKEVGQIVKAAAEKGRRQTQHWMDPGELGNMACEVLESRRNFTSDRDWLDTLVALLRRQGYTVEEAQNKSRQHGKKRQVPRFFVDALRCTLLTRTTWTGVAVAGCTPDN